MCLSIYGSSPANPSCSKIRNTAEGLSQEMTPACHSLPGFVSCSCFRELLKKQVTGIYHFFPLKSVRWGRECESPPGSALSVLAFPLEIGSVSFLVWVSNPILKACHTPAEGQHPVNSPFCTCSPFLSHSPLRRTRGCSGWQTIPRFTGFGDRKPSQTWEFGKL